VFRGCCRKRAPVDEIPEPGVDPEWTGSNSNVTMEKIEAKPRLIAILRAIPPNKQSCVDVQ
jgi:hypothetical protein